MLKVVPKPALYKFAEEFEEKYKQYKAKEMDVLHISTMLLLLLDIWPAIYRALKKLEALEKQ